MEGMENLFLRLRVQMGGNGMGRREHSFLSIPLKPQIFVSPKIGRNVRELNYI